jgi:hypothetical protein
MLYEPTTLASVARLIGESLEGDYGIDPAPLFADLNIDTDKFLRPGARAPFTKMDELWGRAIAATNDPWFATPGWRALRWVGLSAACVATAM